MKEVDGKKKMTQSRINRNNNELVTNQTKPNQPNQEPSKPLNKQTKQIDKNKERLKTNKIHIKTKILTGKRTAHLVEPPLR